MIFDSYVYVRKFEDGHLEGYHKHYSRKNGTKNRKIYRLGNSKYYDGYSLDDRFSRLKAQLRAIDWSLDKYWMDARASKLKSTDVIKIYVNSRELVPYLNSWNKKRVYTEDASVRGELFNVIKTIWKIRRKVKIGVEFYYVSTPDNPAQKLAQQYDFRYNNRGRKFKLEHSYILENIGKVDTAPVITALNASRQRFNYDDFMV